MFVSFLIYKVWLSQALLSTAFQASVLWVLILPLYSRKCAQVVSQESPALQGRLNFGLAATQKCFFCFKILCVSFESLEGGGGQQTQHFQGFILLYALSDTESPENVTAGIFLSPPPC